MTLSYRSTAPTILEMNCWLDSFFRTHFDGTFFLSCLSASIAVAFFDTCRQGELIYVQHLETGFGLATQEPWIQFTSIRENILFGKEYDARFYQEVIEACALSDDLNVSVYNERDHVA